jgi:hypothetical protein
MLQVALDGSMMDWFESYLVWVRRNGGQRKVKEKSWPGGTRLFPAFKDLCHLDLASSVLSKV